MSLFYLSTHCKRWLFTQSDVRRIRQETSASATSRILSLRASGKIQPQYSTSQLPTPHTQHPLSRFKPHEAGVADRKREREEEEGKEEKETPFPSFEDECAFVQFYIEGVPHLCSRIVRRLRCKSASGATQAPLSTSVSRTAMAFMQRFYLKHSVLDYNVERIRYASVFLACKVEENVMSVVDFLEELKKLKSSETKSKAGGRRLDKNVLLYYEMRLVEGLGADLRVYHAENALIGLCDHVERLLPKGESFLGLPELKKVSSNLILEWEKRTDMCLVFPPGLIALAALYQRATERHEKEEFDRFLDRFINENKRAIHRDLHIGKSESLVDKEVVRKSLFDKITQILRYQAFPVLTKETSKFIRHQVRCNTNPYFDPVSKEYQQHEKEKKDAEEKERVARLRKIAAKEEEESRMLYEPAGKRKKIQSKMDMDMEVERDGDDDDGFVIHTTLKRGDDEEGEEDEE